ncbi:peptidyl-prolyl cis-trans isomerase-like 4 [Diaphorina citri]|uniref:Peptidyl-prolyl cis-trans isomerase-like 4 n=1 Tax=Diaphorina citri TaxID=121845 RepID=A0A3Q0JE38_DIACI|nr:peptidyl-prolyl cis-trans isomerase-like 4 [Diaphorina citri]
MVHCGEGLLGSQFFITLGPDLKSLNEHCVFGEIAEGFDILLKLNNAICNEKHRPYQVSISLGILGGTVGPVNYQLSVSMMIN